MQRFVERIVQQVLTLARCRLCQALRLIDQRGLCKECREEVAKW